MAHEHTQRRPVQSRRNGSQPVRENDLCTVGEAVKIAHGIVTRELAKRDEAARERHARHWYRRLWRLIRTSHVAPR